LLAGGSLWYLHSAQSDQDQAHRNADLVQATFNPGGACDRQAGKDTKECYAQASQASSNVTTANHKVLGGYIATGVGAAVLVTGVVLVLTIDGVSKFEPRKKRSSDLYPSLSLAGWAQPGSGGVVLGGRF